MKVRVSSGANDELAQAAYFYLEESPQAAVEFDKAIEAAFEAIERTPYLYPIGEGNIRFKMLERFPFSIYYQIQKGGIEILSIAHHARMPGFWKNRTQ